DGGRCDGGAGGGRVKFPRRRPARRAGSGAEGHGAEPPMNAPQEATTLLSVRELSVDFLTEDGLIAAVDGVSFDLEAGEILAMVGESGCGKSATALALLRLIANPPGRIAGGTVSVRGRDLLTASEEALREVRGNRIAMIFKEPMTSLNPVLSIGHQLGEPLAVHRGLDGAPLLQQCVALLEQVSIPEPARRLADYPHRFSGGMRQRV